MSVLAAQTLKEIGAIVERDRLLIAARQGGDMGEAPDKVAALVETTQALARIHAPHALIGGVAVGIHSGVPRATQDTDIAVRSTADRARVVQCLISAGFRLVGEFPHSANFRHSSSEPVQLAFDPSFDAMIDRAEHFTIDDTPVPIVRRGDLIDMKERAASDPSRRRSKALRDRADVALLRGDVPEPDEGW
jgi:hypothetical protein